MNRTLSIYLDLVRFAAALMVFVTHAQYDRFTSGWLNPLGIYGNDAVMVFFVLSGYVIAHVASEKETNISEYVISRLARLWSVVMPAIFLTLAFDYVGSRIDYSIYAGGWFRPDEPLWRMFANMFFIQELWFSSIRLLSNGPFWSIGYEFWYYVAFALLVYVKTYWRWVGFFLCALIAGPKVMLLMPVWLFGALAYEWSRNGRVNFGVGWLLLIAPIFIYIAYRYFGIHRWLLHETQDWLGATFVDQELAWSREFVGDYFVGICVAAHFVGFSSVSNKLRAGFDGLEKTIRFLAGYTFSIYLLHYPLLHFFAAIIHNDPSNNWHQAIVILAPLATIFLVGAYTEKKKHLAKRLLNAMFTSAGSAFRLLERKLASRLAD